MLRQFGVLPTEIAPTEAVSSFFNAPTENMKTITPLLYQSGYVTIKEYDPETRIYTLDIPNKEIRDLFDTINQLLDITKVGINFDSTQGTIEDWVIEA